MPRFGLKHDEFGKLVLIDDQGLRHVGVEPVRAFPITDPNRFVSILDGEGKEIVLVEDLAELTDSVRSVLEAELARREFIPIIEKIVKVHGESHPTEWEVRTDRGPVRFTINGDDDVRHLGPNRALLVDAQGVRYLIPDVRTLDAASQRVLEVWL
jgi:hypothetical protein